MTSREADEIFCRTLDRIYKMRTGMDRWPTSVLLSKQEATALVTISLDRSLVSLDEQVKLEVLQSVLDGGAHFMGMEIIVWEEAKVEL